VFEIENVTPFMMAMGEIRRRDCRGVTPEHVLYMAMKIMHIRLTEGLCCTFKAMGDTVDLTLADVKDKQFM